MKETDESVGWLVLELYDVVDEDRCVSDLISYGLVMLEAWPLDGQRPLRIFVEKVVE